MSGGATQRCLLHHCSVWPARCGPQVPTAMTCFLMHFSWAPLLPASHPGPPPKCTSHSEVLISGPGGSSLTQRSYVSQPRAGDRETKSGSGGHACLSSPSPPLPGSNGRQHTRASALRIKPQMVVAEADLLEPRSEGGEGSI